MTANSDRQVYVSITGLQIKRWWHVPAFWRYALASMAQARRAPGNISATAKQIGKVHHTLTVWDSRKAMLAFVHSGIHAKAVAAFPAMATGKTYGYLASTAPEWGEVSRLYAEKGRDYFPR